MIGVVLTIAAALTFGLLTVQYALFTAAITTYVVLLTDTLGEAAFHAAGQRASGTALGIAIAAAAFLIWPNPGEGERKARRPEVGRARRKRRPGRFLASSQTAAQARETTGARL